MVINVYYLPTVLKLTLDEVTSGQDMITHALFNNPELRIHRSTNQVVDILARNIDRRAVQLPERASVNFRLYDDNQIEIMTTEASLVNADKGHYQFTLSINQTSVLDINRSYTWCVTVNNDDDVRLLHSDRDYGSHAPVVVVEGPVPVRQEAQTITVESFTDNRSSALKGAAQVANNTGTHSFVVPLSDYTGDISVEATIDDGIPLTENDWVEVYSESLEEFTGNRHIGFVGNFVWVRIVFTNTDGVEDITYRNL